MSDDSKPFEPQIIASTEITKPAATTIVESAALPFSPSQWRWLNPKGSYQWCLVHQAIDEEGGKDILAVVYCDELHDRGATADRLKDAWNLFDELRWHLRRAVCHDVHEPATPEEIRTSILAAKKLVQQLDEEYGPPPRPRNLIPAVLRDSNGSGG